MIGHLFADQVAVEAFTGDGAHGPVYAAPATVACRLEEVTDYRPSADQQQTIAATVLYVPYTAHVPERSQVTLPDGRVTEVAELRRYRGRPGMQHQKVTVR